MTELTLSSPVFEDGESIPERFGYTVDNVNPPLTIAGVPDGTGSLAVVVDDPDAVEPAGKVWDHWVVWNIPPGRTAIPEGWTPHRAVEGRNDFGGVGYGGPNPPDRVHTYQFQVYALDDQVDLPPESTKDALMDAIEGSVLAKATLEGTFAP